MSTKSSIDWPHDPPGVNDFHKFDTWKTNVHAWLQTRMGKEYGFREAPSQLQLQCKVPLQAKLSRWEQHQLKLRARQPQRAERCRNDSVHKVDQHRQHLRLPTSRQAPG
jgi:hypothetical protein